MRLLFLAFILGVKIFGATSVNIVPPAVPPTNDAIKLALLESTLQYLALKSILVYFPKESQEKEDSPKGCAPRPARRARGKGISDIL